MWEKVFIEIEKYLFPSENADTGCPHEEPLVMYCEDLIIKKKLAGKFDSVIQSFIGFKVDF